MSRYRADLGYTNNLWEHDDCTVNSADFELKKFLWEHTGCIVIVLILNKQIIYGSMIDVQL